MLRADIFGYQSLFVCVCVRVQFLPLNSPSCVASHGCPVGTLSLIVCLIDVKAKRDREEKEGGGEEKGMISEKKKKK